MWSNDERDTKWTRDEIENLKHWSMFLISQYLMSVTWFTVRCMMKVWITASDRTLDLWFLVDSWWVQFSSVHFISMDQLNIYKDFIHIASLLESKIKRKKLKIQGRDFFKILMKGTTIQKIFPFFLYRISIFINETLIPLLFIF